MRTSSRTSGGATTSACSATTSIASGPMPGPPRATTWRTASGRPRRRSEAWSPEGTRLAFTGDNDVLWTVRPDGSDLLRMTDTQVTGYTWSPDGGQLAFTEFDPDNGSTDLYVVAVDDPAPRTDRTLLV